MGCTSRLSPLFVFVASTAAACEPSPTEIDPSRLEALIKNGLTIEQVAVDAVHCPGHILPEEGRTLTCTVVIGGKPYDRIATLLNVHRNEFDFDQRWARGEAISSAKLVSAMTGDVSERIGAPVALDCSEPVRFLDRDRSVRCDLAVAALKTAVVFTFDANLHVTEWHTEPSIVSKAALEAGLTPSVQTKLGPQATLTCDGEPLRLPPSDGIIWCTAHRGEQHNRVRLEGETRNDGSFRIHQWLLYDR